MVARVDDKFMRVLLMFDVPVKTKQERKSATKFRNELLKLGYFMMQFSVYGKICKGMSAAQSSINAVKKVLPRFGNVRALIITEKQFDNMQILLGCASVNERMNEDYNLVLFEFDENSGEYKYGRGYGSDKVQSEAETKKTKSANKKMVDVIEKLEKKKPYQASLIEF